MSALAPGSLCNLRMPPWHLPPRFHCYRRARCRRVLPCVIDVGTDNEALQNLDLYMGLHQPRITDQDLYRDIMDEVRSCNLTSTLCPTLTPTLTLALTLVFSRANVDEVGIVPLAVSGFWGCAWGTGCGRCITAPCPN